MRYNTKKKFFIISSLITSSLITSSILVVSSSCSWSSLRELGSDFKENLIALDQLEGYQDNFAPTYKEMLNGIKSIPNNNSLDINAIHIEYTTDRITWISLPTDGTEGVWGTNEFLWLNLWNPNKNHYGDITGEESFGLRLAPNPRSVYYGSTPVELSISFARKSIIQEQDWQSKWNASNPHQFIVNPDENNFKTVMGQEYGSTEFYSRLNTSKAGDCWGFTINGSNGEFAIKTNANPYYYPISTSDAGVDASKLRFKYSILNKENFKDLYETYFTDFSFIVTPTINDVVSIVKNNIVKADKEDDIYWSEVSIAIDSNSQTITVSVPNSLHYTGDSFTKTYTLKN